MSLSNLYLISDFHLLPAQLLYPASCPSSGIICTRKPAPALSGSLASSSTNLNHWSHPENPRSHRAALGFRQLKIRMCRLVSLPQKGNDWTCALCPTMAFFKCFISHLKRKLPTHNSLKMSGWFK